MFIAAIFIVVNSAFEIRKIRFDFFNPSSPDDGMTRLREAGRQRRALRTQSTWSIFIKIVVLKGLNIFINIF